MRSTTPQTPAPLPTVAKAPAVKVIQPGQTLGILGGGQLGRMTTLAAKAMGYKVVVLSPEGAQAPAAQVADNTLVAPYDDTRALDALAQQADVVTQEFENIPSQALEYLTQNTLVPVYPSPQVLHICQHRLREKQWLLANGCPLVPFYPIPNVQALEAIPDECLPGVLKTAGFGYDGKGQIRVKTRFDVVAAFNKLNNQPCVLEGWIDLAAEISVVAARNQHGFKPFAVTQNYHHNHILSMSVYPAPIDPHLQQLALDLTELVMTQLDVVGLLCVEFFITQQGQLLINELAPRPHNSGHITQNGCQTSQFEQHVRAVCQLPLGQTDYWVPSAAMVNVLGDCWQQEQPPNWSQLLQRYPNASLHLYGKAEARAGRKMGHINVTGSATQLAKDMATELRQTLYP
jgi:5-(carboxyamino)imidazole ribonucleotide synthase